MYNFPLAQGDWAAEWRMRHKVRRRPDNVEKWDDRSKDYGTGAYHADYVDAFINYMDIPADKPALTILDIGCGPGTLAIPLAQMGHTVYALDFSQGMLDELTRRKEQLPQEVQDRIIPVHSSWSGDWEAAGVPKVDYVIASRSTMVADLEATIEKVNSFAKEKVCFTLVASKSPKHDPRVYAAVGRNSQFGFDFLYCINILYQMGIPGELRFIHSQRYDKFKSIEDAYQESSRHMGEMTPEEQKALRTFLEQNMSEHTDEQGKTYWRKDYPHEVRWAFVSWRPDERL